MATIRCDVEQAQLATTLFPCQWEDFPIKYLRIPLSVTKLPRSALQSLLDKISDKLPTWRGKLMNKSGRLTLIKTTMTVMPIYIAISLELPNWLLKAMTKLMKEFLWIGIEVA
jgi:hypothetical protein